MIVFIKINKGMLVKLFVWVCMDEWIYVMFLFKEKNKVIFVNINN